MKLGELKKNKSETLDNLSKKIIVSARNISMGVHTDAQHRARERKVCGNKTST